jgi:hypothetical protein
MGRFLRAAALAAVAVSGVAEAQQQPQPSRAAPPHEWLFGSWTGGIFPASDTDGPRCFGQPTVIFTRDVVLRASALDVAYRQRAIETAAAMPEGVEFRFLPAAPPGGAFGSRLPPDFGFGCAGPDLLRVERRGPHEIVFPGCDAQFPFPLKRCVAR